MNIPKGYKLVPVEAHVEKGFEVIHGKHVPTIKIMLPACHADDSKAWDRRDAIGSMILSMIAAAPAPPQPIYDEAKERELFKAVYFRCDLSEDWLSGAFKDKQTRDMWDGWRECAQSRAKAGEVGHE